MSKEEMQKTILQMVQDQAATNKLLLQLLNNQTQPLKELETVPPVVVKKKKVVVKKEEPLFYFGQTTKEYNRGKLRSLIRKHDYMGAQNYIDTYFVRTLGKAPSIWFWDASSKTCEQLKDSKIKTYMPSIEAFEFNDKGKKQVIFETRDYLDSGSDAIAKLAFEKYKPSVYVEKEQLYINMFPGWLHDTKKRFEDFPEVINDNVKKIWNHIFAVWCSSKQDQYDYVHSWLTFAIVCT